MRVSVEGCVCVCVCVCVCWGVGRERERGSACFGKCSAEALLLSVSVVSSSRYGLEHNTWMASIIRAAKLSHLSSCLLMSYPLSHDNTNNRTTQTPSKLESTPTIVFCLPAQITGNVCPGCSYSQHSPKDVT